MRKEVLFVLALVCLLTFLPNGAYAYDIDTHYWLTYKLGLVCGFSDDEARLIATGDEDIDANPNTQPLTVSDSVKERFHALPADNPIYGTVDPNTGLTLVDPSVGQKEIADGENTLYNQATSQSNPSFKLFETGVMLHYTQDKWAHWGFTTPLGHLFANSGPDQPQYNPENFKSMTYDTMSYLGKLKGQGSSCFNSNQNGVIMQSNIDTSARDNYLNSFGNGPESPNSIINDVLNTDKNSYANDPCFPDIFAKNAETIQNHLGNEVPGFDPIWSNFIFPYDIPSSKIAQLFTSWEPLSQGIHVDDNGLPIEPLDPNPTNVWKNQVINPSARQIFPPDNCDPASNADVTWVWDPSGTVYEAVPSNPLQNVTSTITVQNTTSKLFSAWDATGFGQINPELTDSNGHFGWVVPVGNWQVVFDKSGYQHTQTQVYAVPPPRTGILVSMVSLLPPTVTAISAVAPSTVDVQFSKYVLASGLTNSTITVTGQTGKVTPVNAVQNVNGTSLTREAQFTPTKSLVVGTSYTVHVSSLISSYAGVPLSSNVVKTVTATSSPTYTDTVSSNGIQGTTFVLGSTLSAKTSTTNPLSSMTTFGWQSPGGQLVQKVIVNATSGNAVSTFTPTSTGSWKVLANFTDGNDVLQTVSMPVTITLTTPVAPQQPPYITTLLTVYNTRSDLKSAFPEAATGNIAKLFSWAAIYGIHENANLTKFASQYDIMVSYYLRPDLQSAFPEAANGGNIVHLLGWASHYGKHEMPSILGQYGTVYDILSIYNTRSDLQSAFPEAANGTNLQNLFSWAAKYGINEDSTILGGPIDTAVLDILSIYNTRPDLQHAFPQAANDGDIRSLLDWAHQYGESENAAILGTVPNKAVYDVMFVYDTRPDLQQAYPEAADAGDLHGLFSWAVNFGIHGSTTGTILGPNSGFYSANLHY